MKRYRLFLTIAVIVLMTNQQLFSQSPSLSNIHVDKTDVADGYIVHSVTNKSGKVINVYYELEGERKKYVSLDPGKTENKEQKCTRLYIASDNLVLLNFVPQKDNRDVSGKEGKEDVGNSGKDKTSSNSSPVSPNNSDSPKPDPTNSHQDGPVAPPSPKKVSLGDFDISFRSYMNEELPFFKNYTLDSLKILESIVQLRNCGDSVQLDSLIQEDSLKLVVADQKDSIKSYRDRIDTVLEYFFASRYSNREFESKDECLEFAKRLINEKLDAREKDVAELEKQFPKKLFEKYFDWSNIDRQMIINASVVLLILGLLVFWYIKMRKKKANQTPKKKEQLHTVSAQEANSQIRVRRKTTSVLRKQSLADVQDNPAYLQIDTKDFCKDSAVRRIYIKNTCIKGIYNMYADDLRNPDHPNEDGCLVLGRWTYDKEENEYYVSLEEVVYPGDDAVFSEYNLNFGAKIKLKASEMLRRLRKDTDKQYDLTCWVHSHPGMGVFFSNFDANVHMQHKHPMHPNFLTAIVVDILTPDLELGIFTFKEDGTIVARDEMTRLYSLDQFYKWALESERNSFNREDYRNILASTSKQREDCHGIHLNSESIDDIRRMKDEYGEGFKAKVFGAVITRGQNTELIVKKVSDGADVNSYEQIGSLVIANNYSIPTIRRTVADELSQNKFVLVYTITDDMLTAIPVVNQELLTDVEYNGEVTFQNLIEWTRRKR